MRGIFQVAEDQIEALVAERQKGLLAVGGGGNLRASALECPLEALACVLFVIDDEDATCHFDTPLLANLLHVANGNKFGANLASRPKRMPPNK
jgi:hypothetical protein